MMNMATIKQTAMHTTAYAFQKRAGFDSQSMNFFPP